MTSEINNGNIADESRLEEIARGVQDVQEKLGEIKEILYECVDSKEPYDNGWIDLYDIDHEKEYL